MSCFGLLLLSVLLLSPVGYGSPYSKWDGESFGLVLLLAGFLSVMINFIAIPIDHGRTELAATHKIDAIKPDQYLAVDDSSSDSSLRYRVTGELDSRIMTDQYKIIKSDNPHVEIYNNRPTSYWWTVFGGNQITKIYVPNTNITLKS